MKINQLTEAPTDLNHCRDEACCPYCIDKIRDILNYKPDPVQDHVKRVYRVTCRKCGKIFEYPFCPYEESFPETSPHSTSCANTIGCINPSHYLCDSKCYETNHTIENKADTQWSNYINELIKAVIVRFVRDDNYNDIAYYKLKNLEEVKKGVKKNK